MRHSNLRAFGSKPNALRCSKLLRIEEVGSPGRIRTYSLSVNSRKDRKSKCPIWCRLRELGAIFPSLVTPTPAPTRHLQNRVYCLCGNHADFAGRTIQFEINSPRSLTTTRLQFPVVSV